MVGALMYLGEGGVRIPRIHLLLSFFFPFFSTKVTRMTSLLFFQTFMVYFMVFSLVHPIYIYRSL